MIDFKYQGKGYGKASLKKISEISNSDDQIDTLGISTSADNKDAIRIYKKFGFQDTGKIEDGENVFILKLNKS